jgi:hypothetical protein
MKIAIMARLALPYRACRWWNLALPCALPLCSPEEMTMAKPQIEKQDEDTKFNVQAEAQKRKMDQAATKHANKIPGNTEPNAGGANREAGDRRARQNDRATNGGE